MINKKQIKKEVLKELEKEYIKKDIPEEYWDWQHIDKKFAIKVIDKVLNKI